MKRTADLISYLPPIFQGYKEYKSIMDTENHEFQLVFDTSEQVLNNIFIQDCNLEGIKRYEAILKIKPSANDTLETRKFRVLSRWNDEIPYTWKTLLAKLDSICGKDNYSIILINDEYKIQLETHIGVYGGVDELNHVLTTMLPCNLIIISHNVLYGGNETPLYLGVTLSESIHYVLSSDIKGEFSISSELYAALVASNSLKYEISNDIVTNESIEGEAYTVNVSIIGMQYELS
jgi:hypothetical protein